MFCNSVYNSMNTNFNCFSGFDNFAGNVGVFGVQPSIWSGNMFGNFNFNMPAFDFNSMPSFNMPTFSMPSFSMPEFNMPAFNMPSFNFGSNFSFNMPSFNISGTNNSESKTKSTESTSSSTQSYKIGNFNLDYWKSKGYDHDKGKALALDAAKVKRGTPGQCVGYTRKTINRVYGTNFTNAGRAVNFGTTILSQPQLKGKFRKATREEIAQGGIPDGAVVLWKGGSPGFTKGKASYCGHGGICYQGKVYSNYIEQRHLSTYHEIWIPIKS